MESSLAFAAEILYTKTFSNASIFHIFVERQ